LILFTLVLSQQPGLNGALFSGIATEKICKDGLILLAIPEKKREWKTEKAALKNKIYLRKNNLFP